jgi:hypothetical protein
MGKFPVDASLERVLRAFAMLGFVIVRRGNHVSLGRIEADGTGKSPNRVSTKKSGVRRTVWSNQKNEVDGFKVKVAINFIRGEHVTHLDRAKNRYSTKDGRKKV